MESLHGSDRPPGPDERSVDGGGVALAPPADGRPEKTSEGLPFRVTARLPLEASAAERLTVLRLARKLRGSDPHLGAVDLCGPGAVTGYVPDAPCLHLHDLLGPEVVPEHRDLALEERAFGLARKGDLVLVSDPPAEAFVEYCRSTLGLGGVEPLTPSLPARGISLAHRCLRDPRCLGRVVEHARDGGGLNVAPYAGTGREWALAATIAGRSGVPVAVAAAPPLLGRRVNDKIWFCRVVEALLGKRAEPPSFRVHSLTHLTSRVRDLCQRFSRIGIKLPRSAGALGNVVLDVAPLRGRSLAEIRTRLAEILGERGWRQSFPVLLSVWERPVLVSPSVQIWIPHPGAAPVVEGVFDQEIVGVNGAFAGGHPTVLPPTVQERLAHEAGLMALLFQELGYFGRCSFDAILVGEEPEQCAVHWIECNGRWGGMSIPMTLADRLVGDWRRSPFAVLHREERHRVPPRPFADALARLGARLYRDGADRGIVILSSRGIEDGQSLDLMALARTVDEARRDGEEAVRLLT